MRYIMLILEVSLSALFLLASTTKLLDLNHFTLVLKSFGLKPDWLVEVLTYGLPLFEVFLGVGIALGFGKRVLAGIAVVFFISTIILYIANWGHILPYGCGCISIKPKVEIVNFKLVSKTLLALVVSIIVYLDKNKYWSLALLLKKRFPSNVTEAFLVFLFSLILFVAPWAVGLHRQVSIASLLEIDITKEGPKVGEQLPKLNLLTEDDKPITINQQGLENIIFYFGSSSCPACKQLLPYLVKFYEDTKIPIIMISDEQPSSIKLFRQEENIPFPVFFGSSFEWEKLNITIKPFLIYATKDGTVLRKGTAHTYDDLLVLTT
ncbi:Methylamine utilization protein MauD [Pelotomaculum sp. FP]|uniref:MauE/DoxX family redox-associated membrane protein n=1 Tax=Pelotomaculum sp. FP TaxID=261474 RepID=UPI001066C7EB|nr:MauE/DoxX family redox-associated membrane protein [Pelotomaculum sp. FP]TEB16111.1 Methylamine utilization protein MauD [Pelotomaculum sp. FP]